MQRTAALIALLPVLSSFVSLPANAATYDLVTSHSGSSFFDGWEFQSGYDNTTNGDIVWSSSSELAYVNSAGQAILKIDNTTTVPYNEKRDSVKLLSKNWYKPGTVFVFDAAHVPTGCSVWPAWWTMGTNWPAGGEIDIFEPVNLQQTNQNALHTTAGCVATSNSSLAPTGTTGTTECNQEVNGGSGCTVTGGAAGEAFNSAGGGVYVMSFELSGINIWFFSRANVPSSLSTSASSIDTSSLGAPVTAYSSSTCDISTYFTSQQMTLDITACGDYAGSATVLEATCPALVGTATCYTTYVLNSTVYNEAYFQINYLNIYGSSDSIDTALSNTGSTSSSTTSGSATGTSTSRVTGTTTAATNSSGAGMKGMQIDRKGVLGAILAVVGIAAGGYLGAI